MARSSCRKNLAHETFTWVVCLTRLQRPAGDEPGDDLGWQDARVGAEQGLWLELAGRIAQQHPAQRDGRGTGVVPEGGAGRDVDRRGRAAVPGDGKLLPDRVRIQQALRQGRLALTLDPGAPLGPRLARWRGVVQ